MAGALLWYWRFRDYSSQEPGWLAEALALAETTGLPPGHLTQRRVRPRARIAQNPRAWPMAPVLALLLLPVAALGWLLANPSHNLMLVVPHEHLVIVAVISLLALIVAVLVARVALQIEQYKVLFLALGFMTMAGLFAVLALATPGVLMEGPG